MSLRAEQVALTRRRIIETVIELSVEPDAGPITVAEVARRSVISQGTIYRHFPNREAMVSAAATERFLSWTPPEPHASPVDPERAYLTALWSDLAANILLARQSVVTEAGRELRSSRFQALSAVIDEPLRAAGHDPSAPELRRALACVHLLTSAAAFLDLHDRQGLSVDQAVDAVSWGYLTLLEAAGIAPELLLVRRDPRPTTQEKTA